MMNNTRMWMSIAALSLAVTVWAVSITGILPSQLRETSPEHFTLRPLNFTGGPSIIQTSPSPESAVKASGSPASIYEQAKGAVFQIFGGEKLLGTAFLHESGWVITPYHVIAKSPEGLSIRIMDGTTQPVILAKEDKEQDIALLMLTKALDDIRPLVLANSSSLRVGQPVLLIGSAYGIFPTATAGIISGLNRSVAGFAGTTCNCTELVQTDAATGPGSSGGPLLDEEGRVVGMQVRTIDGTDNFNFVVSPEHIKSVIAAADAAR